MDPLNKIKRLIVRGQYRFTGKAIAELETDALDPEDALEAILSAQFIKKTLKSTSPHRKHAREKLYVIEGFNFSGTLLYTKGKITGEAGKEIYYLLVSSKIATYGD